MQLERYKNQPILLLFLYLFIQKHYDVDFGFYFKMFTSKLDDVLMCFMKQLVIFLNQIQPKGALVHLLGELIKNGYLQIFRSVLYFYYIYVL